MGISAAALLRADGIAVSTDGMIWSKGVGDYGDGWETSGRGISVRQGSTIYIKYYSDDPDAGLLFSEHGRKWGDRWTSIGPALNDGVGCSAKAPVILRITDVGTSKSTVAWVNGHGKSGIWSGFPAPGPYDLALHGDARWTLPPIVITEQPRSLWASFLRWLDSDSPPPSGGVHSVPDGGSTAVLLTAALLSLALIHRRR